MLKLEPREAGRVRVPRYLETPADLPDRLDGLIRDGRQGDAQTLADDVILRGGMSLDPETVRALRNGADALRRRRDQSMKDFIEAVRKVGKKPPNSETRVLKKTYSENLSHELAYVLATKLRGAGFSGTRPILGGREGG